MRGLLLLAFIFFTLNIRLHSDTVILKNGKKLENVKVSLKTSGIEVEAEDGTVTTYSKAELDRFDKEKTNWKKDKDDKKGDSKDGSSDSQNQDSSSDSSSSINFNGKLGLGISLLYPTAITAKYMFDDKMGVDFSIGFVNGSAHTHAVFIYNFLSLQSNLSLYTGGGIVFQSRRHSVRDLEFLMGKSHTSSPGIRLPLGLSYMVQPKIELFGEVNMNYFPGSSETTDVGIAIGGRYFF